MQYDPNLKIGQVITNEELRTIFKCGNMSGMRRSKSTNTLVLISDHTKGLYHDRWIQNTLHYTGMGKIGDQVLKGNQNNTLYHSWTNDVEIHLFEVFHRTKYTYKGIVKLIEQPYQEEQEDAEGKLRKVWIFPILPISELSQVDIQEEEIASLDTEELAKKVGDRTGKVGNPSKKEVAEYNRDKNLKILVKRFAEGKCQLCMTDAPFIDQYGIPYLEEHHVKSLADGGADIMANVVAICPNCHRRIHILKDLQDQERLNKIAQLNAQRLERLLSYRRAVRGGA